VHLTGANGKTAYDYVFAGFISYTFKVENGMLTFADPRPSAELLADLREGAVGAAVEAYACW